LSSGDGRSGWGIGWTAATTTASAVRDTRAGSVELQTSKIRQCSDFPKFLEARCTVDTAPTAMIHGYLWAGHLLPLGERLAQSLGLSRVSKSQVDTGCVATRASGSTPSQFARSGATQPPCAGLTHLSATCIGQRRIQRAEDCQTRQALLAPALNAEFRGRGDRVGTSAIVACRPLWRCLRL